MATVEQLEKALRNAHSAGDEKAARRFADEIQKVRQSGPVVAPSQAAPSAVDSGVLGALDTVTLGLADEIGSGLDWAADRILPGGQSRSYEELLALNRGLQQSAQETNPGSYLGGQLAGGVGGGIGLARGGLSLAANAARGGAGLGRVSAMSAADGLILGGAHGAGSGEGVNGRVASATVGGIGGLGLGLAAPVAVAAGGNALRAATAPLMARLNPAPYAERALGQTVQRSGLSVDDIVQQLADARAQGQPMFTVADALGHAGGRQLSAVTRTPNDARQGVVDVLQQRQMGQGERLSNFLSEGFAAPDTAAQRAASLTAQRSADATANYAAVRSGAGAVDPSAAIQAADDFLQPGASRLLAPQTNIADDSVEAAVRRARGYLTDGQSVVSDFDTAFRSKLELDAMIERAQPSVQRQLIPIRNALDNALSSASSGYAGARDTFRRQSQAINAVETGRNAASSRTRAEDNIPAFQGLRPEEQSAFRAGYVDPLIARVDAASISPSTNKARPLMTEKTGMEFPVFAAPGEADRLGARITREQRMFETANAALGGSRTADNLADQADLAQFDPGLFAALAQGRFGQAAMTAIARALNEAQGTPPAVTDRVARALMETDPTTARTALSSSSAAQQASQERTARIIAALLGTGSAGVGRLAAP